MYACKKVAQVRLELLCQPVHTVCQWQQTHKQSNTTHQRNSKLSSVQILVFKVSLQRPKAKN
jgi:hypothetical protein